MTYILADIGGTKTRISSTRDLQSFSDPVVYKTPKQYSEGLNQLIATAYELLGEEDCSGMSIGIAGTLNQPRSKLIAAPHLQNWVNKKLQRNLEQEFGCGVLLENDTAVVGLGEAVAGGGKGFDIVAYISIGTGVGGAKIENGKIDYTAFGFEPGHQIIDLESKKEKGTSKNQLITLEQLSSGSGFEAFKKQNPEARDEDYWNPAPKYLAIGLNNVMLHWSPEVLVLGGGVILHGNITIEEIEKHLLEIYRTPDQLPKIKRAELGDFGGLYGGMKILKDAIEEK